MFSPARKNFWPPSQNQHFFPAGCWHNSTAQHHLELRFRCLPKKHIRKRFPSNSGSTCHHPLPPPSVMPPSPSSASGEFLATSLQSVDSGNVEIDPLGRTLFVPPGPHPGRFGRPPTTKAMAIAERKAAKEAKDKLAEEKKVATASRKAATLLKNRKLMPSASPLLYSAPRSPPPKLQFYVTSSGILRLSPQPFLRSTPRKSQGHYWRRRIRLLPYSFCPGSLSYEEADVGQEASQRSVSLPPTSGDDPFKPLFVR